MLKKALHQVFWKFRDSIRRMAFLRKWQFETWSIQNLYISILRPDQTSHASVTGLSCYQTKTRRGNGMVLGLPLPLPPPIFPTKQKIRIWFTCAWLHIFAAVYNTPKSYGMMPLCVLSIRNVNSEKERREVCSKRFLWNTYNALLRHTLKEIDWEINQAKKWNVCKATKLERRWRVASVAWALSARLAPPQPLRPVALSLLRSTVQINSSVRRPRVTLPEKLAKGKF